MKASSNISRIFASRFRQSPIGRFESTVTISETGDIKSDGKSPGGKKGGEEKEVRRLVTRYRFIDALRGWASLAVLIFHLQYSPFFSCLHACLPNILFPIWNCGALGVQVFFVISGFVIIMSLHGFRIGPRSLLYFAARRQVRLDPPYWTVLATVFLANAVRLLIHNRSGRSSDLLPTPFAIIANIFYIQELVRQPAIVNIAWTLCIEIQFYITAALLVWACRNDSQEGETQSALAVWLMFVTGSVSAAYSIHTATHAWFGPHWCYFAVGSLSYWSIQRRWVTIPLLMVLCQMLVTAAWSAAPGAMLAGAFTALLVSVLGSTGGLIRNDGGKLIQFAGRISYSLYLVHFPISVTVLSVGYHVTRDRPLFVPAWFAVSILASVLTATLLHYTVEQPAMRLSHRLRYRQIEQITLNT